LKSIAVFRGSVPFSEDQAIRSQQLKVDVKGFCKMGKRLLAAKNDGLLRQFQSEE